MIILYVVIGGAVGIVAGYFIRQSMASKKIGTAETRAEKDVKEGERVIHSERYFGKVSRSFRLGQEVDQAKASAKYTDGVLELVLPKKIAASAKRVTIQ